MTHVEEKEATVEVFHRWSAVLDVEAEARTVTFLVSKEYFLEEKDSAEVDPTDLDKWEKVMVLPFPTEQEGEVEGDPVTFAGKPTFFDHEQLSKRYIPVDNFVAMVDRLMKKMNEDIQMQIALNLTGEDSDWAGLA